MTIGCDLITSSHLDVRGSELSTHWDNAAIPWCNVDSTAKKERHPSSRRSSILSSNRTGNAMDDRKPCCKHEKANLEEITKSADHLTNSEQKSLLESLPANEQNRLQPFLGTCPQRLPSTVLPSQCLEQHPFVEQTNAGLDG
jgi:hypothetical protein